MKAILKYLALIIMIAIISIFLYAQFFEGDVGQAREKIKNALAKSDSLQKINDQIKLQIDALRAERVFLDKKIDSLHTINQITAKKINKLIRRLNVYPGTPDDLLRELNEFAKSPLSKGTNPDTIR